MIKTAIYPVAGKGSRLRPATRAVPKELLPVYTTPLLQFAIDEARESGVERHVFVTSDDKPAIEDYVRDTYPELDARFVTQAEPLGLGHAVLMARGDVLDGPVAVILPDDLIVASVPVLAQMSAAHDREFAHHLVAAMKVDPADTASYGILKAEMPPPGGCAPVHGLVEKPDPAEAPSRLAVVGRYILHPGIFETLMTTGRGSGGEIQLTDAIARDLQRMGVAAFRFDGVRFDCGQPDGLVEAGAAFQDVEEMMRAGPAA